MSAQIQVAPSGEYVWPLYPGDFTPRIEDIAHHLSNQCRFAGGTRVHYSVAEHSCRVADLVSAPNKPWALLHDSPEYVLLDQPRPLKHHPFFGEAYRSAEAALMHRICEVFGLPLEEPEEVIEADRRLVVTERRDLLPDDPEWFTRPGWEGYENVEPLPGAIVPWSQPTARKVFLARFHALTTELRVAA